MNKNQFLHITNKNVYLTNILLLPIIVLSYLIINDFKSHIHPDERNWFYILPIYLAFFIMITGFIFSSVYHYFYFDKETSFFKQIGKIDYLITAPLIGVITLTYYIIYTIFIFKKDCNSDLENATIPIFYMSLFFSCLGILSYIIKKVRYGRNFKKVKSIEEKLRYLNMHTFFHYTTYTGISLLFLIFYIENKEIYNCLFV